MTTSTNQLSTGFSQQDFDVFLIEGLEKRMSAIIAQIRPKFAQIGESIVEELAMHAGTEMYLHIAKHARRTVNPPKDTWLALCHNKRGYKAHPHFQIGLYDDHLFIWFALIYELPNKRNIASKYLADLDHFVSLIPDDYVVSQDHMKKAAVQAGDLDINDWEKLLMRFRNVGKAELLIGRHLLPNDPTVQDQQQLAKLAMDTYEQLMPLYRQACQI